MDALLKRHDPGDTQLFDAARRLTSESGLQAVTLRGLSRLTNISASGLVYRFGSREAFLDIFLQWCVERAEIDWQLALKSVPEHLSVYDLASLTKAIITRCALGYREDILILWSFQLAALPQPSLADGVREWRTHDTGFWQTCLKRAGMDAALANAWAGTVLALMRVVALSNSTTNALCWVDDVVTRLTERLARAPITRPGDSLWRQFAEQAKAERTTPLPEEGTTARKITETAASIIMTSGCAALSHRAIAKQSGVSLSSTTHHFATLDHIMLSAFDLIYSRAREKAREVPRSGRSFVLEEFLGTVLPQLSASASRFGPSTTALEDIMLSASRYEKTAHMAPALMARTGETMTSLLQAVTDTTIQPDRLDGHVVRLALSGMECGDSFERVTGHDSPLSYLLRAYL